ncbi:CDP-glycerol glycerophosphotransferase family protein [Roseovarius sp. S1116L3]|uniref:CDP-glycerol glycerophosphotransferase family protein n=1 Tax=Roseovarius roseus TaxID=3342636 RepID=UPI0037297938
MFRLFGRKLIEKPAFLVHTPEIANHFAPIWDALGTQPFDVLMYGSATLPTDMSADRWPMRIRHVSEVISTRQRYDVLISNHIIELAFGKGRRKKPLINRLGRTNLRMMYAAGKTGWNLSDWNSLYDGVLCFGPYHAEAFTKKFDVSVFQMGYPRFDRYFDDPPAMDALRRQMGCDPAKPTIVWLPTWRHLSSVGHFNAEISALKDEFNVVVKVHPLMPKDEPERVAALSGLGFNAVIVDSSDNLPLYQLADYMLFDYGGPPFAGIYTNKRFVLLNVPDADKDELTGPDSPDLMLRNEFANVDAGADGIRPLLREGAHWEDHQIASDRLRAQYFAPRFGTSAKAAAEAIMDRKWIQPKRKQQ